MSTNDMLKQFQESVSRYLEELNQFSMEQLTRQPDPAEWSIGQMYIHLIQSALYMQLANIEKCRTGAGATTGEKTDAGREVYARGEFPPIRIQVPASPQYTPSQPVSKEQIVEGLNTVVARMQEVEPTLQDISSIHKFDHPRFGALDAREWFLLIEMHYRHHFHQLNRLKNEL
ncbi:MAG: hypothetical protein K0R47_2987, partial [Brevibacillus sp.]|nr:hypothetical protein [Brevibacillus sp.]